MRRVSDGEARDRPDAAPGRGVLGVAVGAVVLAVGVGLGPHVIGNGLTATGIVSLALLATGLGLVVRGGWVLARGRRRLGRSGVVAGTIIVVALVVWLIAPPVAATHVRDTAVSATPEEYGLDHAAVTLTTADGVELAAWLLPGTNGAGLVVLHGAGSTRSNVLDQAAVLVAHGYTALLIDARGHGDSGGTAMDFGWYGDLDIGAGTRFLAERAGIDPHRIGVVGFSMGGEEAIGAAATDPYIRAVVAEGATGRTAADKAWYSDTYGWRGWVQEQVEKVQFGITDLLTDASSPPSLRTAVSDAADTAFLLITAGHVPDEAHAAAYLAAAGGDRVTVWNVNGAGHTGGYATEPDQWEQRVVGFLDAQPHLTAGCPSGVEGSRSDGRRTRTSSGPSVSSSWRPTVRKPSPAARRCDAVLSGAIVSTNVSTPCVRRAHAISACAASRA